MKFENKVLVEQTFGDGKLPVAMWFLDHAPKFYIVRIDSKYTPKYSEDICPSEIRGFMQDFDDDVFEAIAEQFDECWCDDECDCEFPTLPKDFSKKYRVADKKDLKGFEV